jgi:ABC-type transport system substrate-binding protein
MPYFVGGSKTNVSRYSNPKMDQLFRQQSQEPDPVKRKAIVQDIERFILSEVVCIPDGLSGMGLFRWPYVKGFVPSGSPYGTHLQMEKVWLDK